MLELIFLMMVFSAVTLLILAMVVPVFGEGKQTRKRLKKRLKEIGQDVDYDNAVNLLREKYLKKLSPVERWFESLPGVPYLTSTLREAGYQLTSYRYVMIVIAIVVAVFLISWLFLNVVWISLVVGLGAGALIFAKLIKDRNDYLAKYEEQLPDALDIMKRALQAGHPFVEAMNLVATEMPDPIAKQFEITFNDLNYGSDLRPAMLGMLERVPSITMMGVVTAILVQKETGGNLAEILENISSVIRGRYRFHRRVKTLSAEGRMSAWVLILVPFVLFLVISITTPTYLPTLTESELGRTLIIGAFLMMVVGIFWIRRIIRIDV